MKHVEIFTQNYDKVFTDKTIKKTGQYTGNDFLTALTHKKGGRK